MNRLIILIAMIILIACNGSEPTEKEQTDTVTNSDTPTTATTDLDVDELAKATCDCVKKLTEERDMIAKYREEGNKAEALKLITSSKSTQRAAFDCSKPLIESIRYDQEKWQSYEDAMLTICPQGGTALLIMHDIHYKEE